MKIFGLLFKLFTLSVFTAVLYFGVSVLEIDKANAATCNIYGGKLFYSGSGPVTGQKYDYTFNFSNCAIRDIGYKVNKNNSVVSNNTDFVGGYPSEKSPGIGLIQITFNNPGSYSICARYQYDDDRSFVCGPTMNVSAGASNCHADISVYDSNRQPATSVVKGQRYAIRVKATGCQTGPNGDTVVVEVLDPNNKVVLTNQGLAIDPGDFYVEETPFTPTVTQNYAIRVYQARGSITGGQIGGATVTAGSGSPTSGGPTGGPTGGSTGGPTGGSIGNPSTGNPSTGNPSTGNPNTGGPSTGGTSTTSSSGCNPGAQLCNPLESGNLGQLMLVIMKAFIALIAAWAVLFIVVAGFKMVISQGNSEALTQAKATMTWAIAGVIVSLLAFSIVAIVQNLIGYKGL